MGLTSSRNIVEILISAQDQASAVLKKAGSNVTTFEKQIVVASAAIAASNAAILTGITALAVSGARYASVLDSISKHTLVTRETIASLGVQLAKNGGQFEDSEIAVRSFDQAVLNAIAGQKEAIAQFQRLGVSIDDLVGPDGSVLGFEQLLPKVADGFVGIRDEAVKVSSAVALFGRSGTNLIPILSRGADGLADMRREAQEVGAILDGDLQQQASEFGESLDDVKVASIGLRNTLAAALNPTLGQEARELAKATIALTDFAKAHPQVIQNIVAVSSSLLVGGGLIASVTLARTKWVSFLETLTKLGALKQLGGAFTDVAGRTQVLGKGFVTARAAALANIVALGQLAIVVAGVGLAVSKAVEYHTRMLEIQKRWRQENEQLEATIKSTTSTIDEQAIAYDRLRQRIAAAAEAQAQIKASAPGFAGEHTITPTVAVEANIKFAREKALADFDKKFGEVGKDLLARAGFLKLGLPVGATLELKKPKLDVSGLDPAAVAKDVSDAYHKAIGDQTVKVPGPTVEAAKLLVPAPQVDVEPIDASDLNAQVERQRSVVNDAKAKYDDLLQQVNQRQQNGTLHLAVQLQADFAEAKKAFTTENQKFVDLQQRAQQSLRDTAKAAREAGAALTQLDEASGRITLGDALTQQKADLEAANSELAKARVAFESATAGTKAYADATDNVTAALQRVDSAQSRVTATTQEIEQRRAQSAQSTRDVATATRELAEAEQDLATVRAGGTKESIQSQLDTRNLERLRKAKEEAQAAVAGAQVSFGSVPAPILENAAQATRSYADAMLQAIDAQKQMDASAQLTGAAMQQLGGTFSSLLSGIADGSVDAAGIFKRAMVSMISEMVRAAIQAALLKKLLSGIGAGVGGASPFGFGLLTALAGAGKHQSGGTVVSGIRGVDNQAAFIGRDETIMSHDLTDHMRDFLKNDRRQNQRDALALSRDNSSLRDTITRAFSDLPRSIRPEPARTQAPARASEKPVVHITQHTTVQAGIMLGTEIESNHLGQEVNERSRRFARQYVATPGFTG